MRCEFKRTKIWFGPRNGVHSKTWRCSRKACHTYIECSKKNGIVVELPVELCTQHLQVAKRNELN